MRDWALNFNKTSLKFFLVCFNLSGIHSIEIEPIDDSI